MAEDKENLVETDPGSGLTRGWDELMDNAERLTEAREAELEAWVNILPENPYLFCKILEKLFCQKKNTSRWKFLFLSRQLRT